MCHELRSPTGRPPTSRRVQTQPKLRKSAGQREIDRITGNPSPVIV
jgi:hypothetical protein